MLTYLSTTPSYQGVQLGNELREPSSYPCATLQKQGCQAVTPVMLNSERALSVVTCQNDVCSLSQVAALKTHLKLKDKKKQAVEEECHCPIPLPNSEGRKDYSGTKTWQIHHPPHMLSCKGGRDQVCLVALPHTCPIALSNHFNSLSLTFTTCSNAGRVFSWFSDILEAQMSFFFAEKHTAVTQRSSTALGKGGDTLLLSPCPWVLESEWDTTS